MQSQSTTRSKGILAEEIAAGSTTAIPQQRNTPTATMTGIVASINLQLREGWGIPLRGAHRFSESAHALLASRGHDNRTYDPCDEICDAVKPSPCDTVCDEICQPVGPCEIICDSVIPGTVPHRPDPTVIQAYHD